MKAHSKPKQDDALLTLIAKEFQRIDTRLVSIELRLNRSRQQRYYFLNKIKCLQVEKQSLVNYIKEIEKFNNFPE